MLQFAQFGPEDEQNSSPPAEEVPAPRLVSPALYAPTEKAVPAFEMKFLLAEEVARAVEERVRGVLALDPHAAENGGTYQTTSLYCDTPQFDVFHRTGVGRRRKHRLRRYGREPQIFLERKSKKGQRVRKRRTVITEPELPLLTHPLSLVNWQGYWFHRRLLARQLQPVCRVSYERTAYMGPSPDGPIRLTFDRNLRGCLESAWRLEPVTDGPTLYPGEVVCEFKFRNALPPLFKGIITDLRLTPGGASKYRRYLGSLQDFPGRPAVSP